MGIELRMPSITAPTEREQLAQIRSYLYQIVPQLQWALDNVNSTGVSNESVEQIIRSMTAPSSAPSPSVSAEVTFEKIKPLIIKSAEIVEAYYEEINKNLRGQYVAESVFGTFVGTTEQNIKETSNYVEQKFSDVQIITNEINGEIENINSSIDGANANIEGLQEYVKTSKGYIRSGEIDRENEIPVYGIEIGQDNGDGFKKFARFTADKLVFYDQNGADVAYISDYKLYIRNVEITSSFKIGGFIETVMPNGDVVTKWVGRG